LRRKSYKMKAYASGNDPSAASTGMEPRKSSPERSIQVADEIDWAKGKPGRLDILEVLSHARSPVFIPNKWDAFGPFFDAWGYTVDGEKTAQQAMDDAEAAIQENLDKEWANWDEQNA
jgi:hypothetical protein